MTAAANPVMDRAMRVSLVEITTPEGVPLRFQVARAGDRMAAFLLDGLIIGLVLGAVALILGLASPFLVNGLTLAVVVLLFFFLKDFYFAFFEIRWQGQTPGKRKLGIRVIDRFGGPLRAESVLARNFMREVELYIPVTVLVVPSPVLPDTSGWVQLLAFLWALALLAMPLFNRQRLRPGDVVGGTLVVAVPRAWLLADVSAGGRLETAHPEPAYTFTNEQLAVYGIYELQVLEDVLRRRGRKGSREVLEAVCSQIRTKIHWNAGGHDVDSSRFLQDFYVAQRAALEHQMLLGKRRERKRSTRGGRRGG